MHGFSFFLLTFLSLTLIFHNSKADLITDVCSKSTNPTSCDKTLRSDPRSSGSDLRGLGQVALAKSRQAVRLTMKVAKSLGGEGAADTCVETCGDAIESLNECKSLLKKSDRFSISTLQTRASAAISDVGTCDDEYEGGSEPESLKEASKAAKEIIDVLLVIANSL